MGCSWVVVVLLALAVAHSALADETTHKYKRGERVVVWANKVGPYSNPQETYSFFKLPFCQPPVMKKKRAGLGEGLQGIQLVESSTRVHFKETLFRREICTVKLSKKKRNLFVGAVENNYWYEFYIDDIPVWGLVGMMMPVEKNAKPVPHVFTHSLYSIGYNKDQIVEVNLTTSEPVPLGQATQNLKFMYSVRWTREDTPFELRMDKLLDRDFFEHNVHWFAIFNSFMMVVFLVGLVAMIIMRVLKRDYARFAEVEEGIEHDMEDESGWKQIHRDVLRPPQHLSLFSAVLGSGSQLVTLMFVLVVVSVMGSLHYGRGAMLNGFIVSYILTAFVSGFVSGRFYAKHGGVHWKQNVLISASIFPCFAFALGFLINFLAVAYGSSAAIPFFSMVSLLFLWAFLTLPLAIVGAIVGRNMGSREASEAGVRPSAVPKPIPTKPWYLHPTTVALLAGALPFGSIFVEVYFVFTSFWNYKVYYVYGFMLLVAVILIAVTMCISVVVTYVFLNLEDYRWQWMSFASGASTAVFVYAYAVYYFVFKTSMFGLFQIAFYFGYSLVLCVGLAISCGTVAFVGATLFVHRIYRNLKSD